MGLNYKLDYIPFFFINLFGCKKKNSFSINTFARHCIFPIFLFPFIDFDIEQ